MIHSFCSYQIHLIKQLPNANNIIILMQNICLIAVQILLALKSLGILPLTSMETGSLCVVGIYKYHMFVPIIYKRLLCLEDWILLQSL